ncbi:hypothetical protein [Melissospora conviva]|uniref:hypothetical protein n=1 Tax=Melissospora conviva TaxID=3388432 RepID=UPI003C1BDEEA
MARIRTIKPEFWSSPGMSTVNPYARLLFIAMWGWADDYGVGTANPKELGGFAFPEEEHIDSADIRRMLGEIRRVFGVVFYRVGNRPYYYIPSWEKHQRVDRRSKQRHPMPAAGEEYDPNPEPAMGQGFDQQKRSSVRRADEGSTLFHETPPRVPGNVRVGTEEQRNRGTEELTNLCSPDEPANTDVPLFATAAVPAQRAPKPKPEDDPKWIEFWKAYPRKEARINALKAWVTATKKVDPDLLTERAHLYAQRVVREGRPRTAVKMAQGWLSGQMWEDEDPANQPTQTQGWRQTTGSSRPRLTNSHANPDRYFADF